MKTKELGNKTKNGGRYRHLKKTQKNNETS